MVTLNIDHTGFIYLIREVNAPSNAGIHFKTLRTKYYKFKNEIKLLSYGINYTTIN